ncbi:MAG: alpha/beta hydrolase [Bifidobacteriaceae bacterium]|jgi:pimeloyl-ACP methyl ester carboxylesterase|nr:alpha/beta hydrolase [Bifidobacteriaceae bacterium]
MGIGMWNGGSLAQADTGRAATGAAGPLVLLHAFPVDHRLWQGVADLLAGIPVLLVDLPGAGASAPPDPAAVAAWPSAVDGVAAQVDEAVRARGYDHAVVAGISMGGYVAMATVRQAPAGFLQGLALLDTKHTVDAPEAAASRHAMAREVLATGAVDAALPMGERLLAPGAAESEPELVRLVRGWIREQLPAGIAWCQEMMATRPDSTETLRSVTVPAAVIVGEADRQATVDAVREMARLIPGAELTVVPGAGHLTPLEAPEAVAAALRALYGRAVASR